MANVFTQESRVQLYFKVLDHLPAPTNTGFGEEGGHHLYKLDEILKRCFGRISLADGPSITKIFQNFILGAPEKELLTLIQYVPAAYYAAELESMRGMYSVHSRYDAEHDVGKIIEDLNHFLQFVGSPARFISDGGFTTDSFAVEMPEGLSRLRNKEVLLSDLQTQMQAGYPIAAIFIDLDNFKAVNDELKQHEEGTRCLEAVALLIGEVITKKGKLYRYGGDEFVVLLPNFQLLEALPVADRMRAEIDRRNPGGAIRVTASIGVASSEHQDLKTPQTLIAAADSAMYVSKNSGRNKVTISQPAS